MLRDPRTNEIRYVGKTVQSLAKRLGAHIHNSAEKRTHRDCWIAGLLMAGSRPTIEKIDVAGDDWADKERYWIKFYRDAGADLTNRTDGGEGSLGMEVSVETRAIISIQQSARMTEEYRAQIAERVRESWTAERRAEWGGRVSERFTPEERERRSRFQSSPEMLARQRAKQIEVWTPERRAARAAQVKAQMTPERVAAHREKLRQTTASPEWKVAHSAREKSKWTPEMRAAQAEKARAHAAARRAKLTEQAQ